MKSVKNWSGDEIPWDVVIKHVWSPDTWDLADRVWEEGDQDPQAFFNNFCATYEAETGKIYWLDEPKPQF